MYIRCFLRVALLFFLFDLPGKLPAAEPQLINYQGRIAVSGANFTGAARFKFAFVDATGSTTYWSNDGTSAAGAEPTAAVSLTVNAGLYSVLLGDTALAHMTVVPDAIFANGDVYLRVWFDDGMNGMQLLTPDQRIAAAANVDTVGRSSIADNSLVSSVTPSTGLVNAAYIRIGPGTPTSTEQQETSGTPPSARYWQTAVWTGSEMIVWGGFYDPPGFLNNGSRYNPAANSWTALPTTGAPLARDDHTAVWTGNEMIVWGGNANGVFMNDGARYNPTTDSWTALPAAGAPLARVGHTVVWTGNEMIVWGGSAQYSGRLNDGGRFNPTTNSWTALPTTGAPAGRMRHTAVWTGSEMIIWGGDSILSLMNSGGRYNPMTNSWTAATTTGAPLARSEHTAVWTGSEMIVWGGYSPDPTSDGGRYNPVTNSWMAVTAAGAAAARYKQTAVWTGSEMIVWGGLGSSNMIFNDGGRYNPVGNSWTAVTTIGAPVGRGFHTAVWTGSEMIVWGGSGGDNKIFDDGGRYDPVGNSWISLTGGLPVITTQPASQSVIADDFVGFWVVSNGSPPLTTFQWQIMSAGFGSWLNLSDGRTYNGSTSTFLRVFNITGGMSGDQFRCVATNSVGSATSNAAVLTVIVAPSQAIITLTVE